MQGVRDVSLAFIAHFAIYERQHNGGQCFGEDEKVAWQQQDNDDICHVSVVKRWTYRANPASSIYVLLQQNKCSCTQQCFCLPRETLKILSHPLAFLDKYMILARFLQDTAINPRKSNFCYAELDTLMTGFKSGKFNAVCTEVFLICWSKLSLVASVTNQWLIISLLYLIEILLFRKKTR